MNGQTTAVTRDNPARSGRRAVIAGAFLTTAAVTTFAAPAAVTLRQTLDCYTQGCQTNVEQGDTYVWTAWTPTGTTVANGTTVGGTVYGTLNDGSSRNCDAQATNQGGNIQVIRLDALDLATPSQTRFSVTNCMSSFGVTSAVAWTPSPDGQCTAGFNNGCSWKSYGFISVNGALYLQVLRQEGPLNYIGHDSSIVMSRDGGATWVNPAHVGGTPSLFGDAPAAPGDPSYPAAILWHDAPPYDGKTQWMARLSFVQVCQDQTMNCPDVDNSGRYVYAMALSGDFGSYHLARVLKTDLPHLAVSEWQYYRCPDYATQACDGNADASWSNVLSDATGIGSGGGLGADGQVMFLRDEGVYVFSGIGAAGTFTNSTAPHPWGPWTALGATAVADDADHFAAPLLFSYNHVGPGDTRYVVAANNYLHIGGGTVYFHEVSFHGDGAAVSLPAPGLSGVPSRVSVGDTLRISYDPALDVSFLWSFSRAASGSGVSSASSSPPALNFRTATRAATLSDYGLTPGSYVLTVQAFQNGNTANVSPKASQSLDIVASAAGMARVFPNPWRKDRTAGALVTFDHLGAGTKITLYTLSGRKVTELRSEGPAAAWDLRTIHGEPAGSGLYLYLITDGSGGRSHGTLSIIR